jgi:hypothetical protein
MEPTGTTKSNVFDTEKTNEPENDLPLPLPQPNPRYSRWDHSMTVVCNDCGVVVFDTHIHDDFHSELA